MVKKLYLLTFILLFIFINNPERLWSAGRKEKVAPMLSESEKKELLQIARESLEHYLKTGNMKVFSCKSENLKTMQGAFVTLKNHGKLRGCIGYIIGVKPLFETVAEMAVNAGTRDMRFPPVTLEELKDITFEITAMTPLEKISSPDEIEVGKHGLYIKKGFYSGLLLPQVATEYGWDKLEFLKNVCFKAGLPGDAWKEGAEIFTFSGQVFSEKEK